MKITKTSDRTSVNMRAIALSVLATVCMAAASPSVRADSSEELDPPAKTVDYRDLNLASPQGVEVLYRRIVAAARQVCSALDGRSLEQKAHFSICTKESIARAVAAVDHPALSELQAVKTGRHDGTTRLAQR